MRFQRRIGAVACAIPLGAGVAAAPPSAAQATDDDRVAAGDASLAERHLAIPVEGVTSAALRDRVAEGRGRHRHDAIDIAAPRGAKVFAADDGRIVKLFTSVSGRLTVCQFDPQGRLAFYDAHLEHYADGPREGMTLQRCSAAT